MATLLLVEDDHDLGMTLEMSFVAEGHTVRWCKTLTAARASWEAERPNLLLVDLGLPDGDGLTLCREVRNEGQITPIVVLTARSTLADKLEGLRIGADDYVTKPFDLPELIARVDAQIRRQRWHGTDDSDRVQIGNLTIDFEHRNAWCGDETIELTDLELRLLKFLLQHVGEAISREALLEAVWGLEPATRTRTVDVFISRLRRLIEPEKKPRFLRNVRGVGYRLVLEQN